jgi:ABC-type transport system involved in multi-copper enzyme maturation permease subunit
MLVAALLGAGVVSEEARRGTIFLLLDKPVSRERVLLAKYVVSAAVLLALAMLGSATLLAVTGALGYPQDAGGVFVSAVLMWLGLLFVLGTALALSVTLENTLLAVVGTFLVWLLTSVVPAFIAQQAAVLFLSSQEDFPSSLFDALALSPYWTSLAAYSGESLPTTQLLVGSVASAVPLLAALWLFRRKEY